MNTEYDVCDPALYVLEVVGISLVRNSVSEFFFHEDEHQRKAQGWQVASQRLAAPPRKGAYGPPSVTGAGLDALCLGGRRKVLKARLFSSAQAAGNWLGGSVGTTSGSRTDAEIRCDWWASEHPFLLPLPSLASNLLTRLSLPSTPGELLLSDGRRGGRKWSYQFSPPDTALHICLAAASWNRWLFCFLQCCSKDCSIYQQCFLIT